jgi:hypothetical protein
VILIFCGSKCRAILESMDSNNFGVSEINHGNNLTPEKLRSYNGFENLSDEEAEKNIELIKVFSDILYRLYCNENRLVKSGGKL